MQALLNKDGQVQAFLFNKSIIDQESKEAIGVILGNIVFGSDSEPKGKFLNHTIYNTDGYIAAIVENVSNVSVSFPHYQLANSSWKIIKNISNYFCPWLELKDKWSYEDVTVLLKRLTLQPA